MTLDDLLLAFCLLLVVEGLFVALMPTKIRSMLTVLTSVPPLVLRYGGLLIAGLGIFLIWLTMTAS